MTRTRMLLLAAVLLTACPKGSKEQVSAPALPVPPPHPSSRAASRPASQPASRPAADLAVELSETASLSASRLRAHVAYLASDALEGRGAATDGIHAAADYLAESLQAIGLEPAFGDRFKQPFEMVVATRVGPKSRLTQGGRPFRLGKDFAPYPFSTDGRATGIPVFAGYGIKADEHQYDDYEGIDVAGRVVFVLDGEPGEDDPKSPFDGRKRTGHASVRKKLLHARQANAAAIVVIRDELRPRDERRHGDPESDAGLVALQVTTAAAAKILGFDPAAAKREIDAAYEPKSREVDRPALRIRSEVIRERRTVHNVGGKLLPTNGSPPKEWVVIGAHYDHLGYGGADSTAASTKPQIHNGADDNASGTAVVIEAARAISRMKDDLKRGVFFFLFAGEEDGLLGSAHLVKHPPVPMESISAMVNLDMVGHLRNRRLHVMGTKTALELESFAEEVVQRHGLTGSFGGDGYGPSDHTSFYAEGVPVLFLFTGAHSHYHKPTDDPETLSYLGMAEAGAVATDLVRGLAMAEERPTYVKAAPPKSTGRGRGYGPYFGSIPDFGQRDDGVLLSGVRDGSPADEAGVRKGDVIVRFGKYDVKNLRDFTIALRDQAPGDEVVVVVMRDGKRIETKAVLRKRD